MGFSPRRALADTVFDEQLQMAASEKARDGPLLVRLYLDKRDTNREMGARVTPVYIFPLKTKS